MMDLKRDTCIYCGTEHDERHLDDVCDACDPLWMEQIAKVSEGVNDNLPIRDLFLLAHVEMLAVLDMRAKLERGGTVPVHRYGWGQDVRYLPLGGFATSEGHHYFVVCTLERGKANMRRVGLHVIPHGLHNASASPVDSLAAADATAAVRKATLDFRTATTERPQPIWMNGKTATEVLRVAATWSADGVAPFEFT